MNEKLYANLKIHLKLILITNYIFIYLSAYSKGYLLR